MNKRKTLKTGFISVATAGAFLGVASGPLFHSSNVNAAAGSSYVTLNAFSGHPAAMLTVSGGNYDAGETVAITVVENGKLLTSTTTKAEANGNFSASVTLPTKLGQGNAVITASGETSGQSASNSYYVAPFTPIISTSASSSDPFAPLTVSGSGYAPNETVSINFAGKTSLVKADANGDVANTAITTPNVPAASYTLVGTGNASGASSIAYQYINAFYASVSPDAYYVLPQAKLGFNGSGFAAGETITVTDTANAKVLSSFKAGSDGTFTSAGSFVVPASFAGLSKEFVVTGSTSKATASATVTIGKYFPSASPSVYYTMPGTSVSFNGSGFAPGETVDIMSGATKLDSVVADKNGRLENAGNVLIPLTAAGTNQTYTLVGQTSQASTTATVQVGTYSPQALPSSYYVQPGSTITFSGTGYAPGETVSILDGEKVVGSFKAGSDGAFENAGTVAVAYSQAGSSVKLTLVGSISKTPQTISFGVGELSTQLSPSSYYVLPFEKFDVSATGFAPSETITLKNGTTILGTTKTDASGKAVFSGVSLPASKASSATLVATGATSHASNSVSVGLGSYFVLVSSSDYYVKPGSTVTLSGSGFLSGEPISISANGKTISATADSEGAFSQPFIVPFGVNGSSLTITVTGEKSTATTTTDLTLAPFSPQVSPSTYYATPGSPVSFTGSGYVAGETVTITLGKTVVDTEKVASDGSFTSKASTLPFGKSADYTITSSLSKTSTALSVGLAQFYAGSQLSSYYGNGGSSVAVTGSGYAPGETVTTSNDTTILGTTKADSQGSFKQTIVIPYAAPGDIAITSTGALSQATSSTQYTVATVYTSLELKSYSVEAGQAVTLIGSGYFANEPVTLTSDRVTGSKTITASNDGSFNSGYIIPSATKAGDLTLTVSGQYSHTVHTIKIYVSAAKQ